MHAPSWLNKNDVRDFMRNWPGNVWMVPQASSRGSADDRVIVRAVSSTGGQDARNFTLSDVHEFFALTGADAAADMLEHTFAVRISRRSTTSACASTAGTPTTSQTKAEHVYDLVNLIGNHCRVIKVGGDDTCDAASAQRVQALGKCGGERAQRDQAFGTCRTHRSSPTLCGC